MFLMNLLILIVFCLMVADAFPGNSLWYLLRGGMDSFDSDSESMDSDSRGFFNFDD